MSVLTNLGCNLDLFSSDFRTCLKHLVSDYNVCILDPRHMLKLVRNTLGDKKLIFDENDSVIKWDYINLLHKVQEQEGLHFGNQLRSAHVACIKVKRMHIWQLSYRVNLLRLR